MKEILIIEDDVSLREELAILLKNSGYQVICISDFHDVLDQMNSLTFDIALLDINLPEVNGEVLLQKFRQTNNTPVIMLTSRSAEVDEVLSMSYGADDYITKPYNPTILLLRISAILKRATQSSNTQKYHDVQFSPVKGCLMQNGSEQMLTKNETIIFQLLLEHQGEIVTRDELMTVLWDNSEFIDDNTLSVNVSRLRKKLAMFGHNDAIETRKKQGYILK